MQSAIKSFSINGLFGTKNVHIPFDDNPVKVLIGANGSGKTHVLAIFNYVLRCDFDALQDYPFNSISIDFDKETLIFKHSDIDLIQPSILSKNFSKVEKGHLSKIIVDIKKQKIDEGDYLTWLIENKFSMLEDRFAFEAFHFLKNENFKSNEENTLIQEKRISIEKVMSKYINDTMIKYFPTYQLFENKKSKKYIAHSEKEYAKDAVEDVLKRFTEIKQQITALSKDGFSTLTSKILKQMTKGIPTVDKFFLDKVKASDLDIILARVGDEMTEDDKKDLKELVINKKITDNNTLYFLAELIEIYNSQQQIDNKIRFFVKVCNNYLSDKKIIFDEPNLNIQIQKDGMNTAFDLNKLSLGEKQIISILAKVYLGNEKNCIVIFDEPELSLSIFWQEKLLPDIINSGNVSLLLAATHSPAIYANEEIFKYTFGMKDFTETIHPKTTA